MIIKNKKIKVLKKLFRENKTGPLLKTPEKGFQSKASLFWNLALDIHGTTIYALVSFMTVKRISSYNL